MNTIRNAPRRRALVVVMLTLAAKRLRMQMLLGVSMDELVKAFHEGILRNTLVDRQTGVAACMTRLAGLLLIFVGERPVDPEMKIGLLSGPVG